MFESGAVPEGWLFGNSENPWRPNLTRGKIQKKFASKQEIQWNEVYGFLESRFRCLTLKNEETVTKTDLSTENFQDINNHVIL